MRRPVPLWSLIIGSVVSLFIGIGLTCLLRSHAPKETGSAVPTPTPADALGAGERVAVATPAIVVQVFTTSPGMSAQSIEKTITNRIERWVNQVPGAARIESKSLAGVSVVTIYFRNDTDPNTALTMTNSLALSALPTLPPNTLPPVVLPRNDFDLRQIIDDILKKLAEPGGGAT